MSTHPVIAPPLNVSAWFNTDADITLASLRGRVVVLHAFQMLCPACVSHGLPQAAKVHRLFSRDDVVVLGLHTVFEHHDAMTPNALKAFLHEYRVPFPVGVDEPSGNGSPVPMTMEAYALKGTPSLVVIDRQGVVRLHHFGVIDDLQLGAFIGMLVAEDAAGPQAGDARPVGQSDKPDDAAASCTDDHCALPH